MNTNAVTQMFLDYINYNYLLGVLFVIALGFYIGRSFRTDRMVGTATLFAVIFPFVTIFNPILYNLLSQSSESVATYYRFIWAFPLIPLTAAFLTEMVTLSYHVFSAKSPKTKHPRVMILSTVTAFALSGIILFSGTSYLSPEHLTVPENKFNISRATLDISQFIHDDPDHEEGDVVLAPTEIMMELEAYDITLTPALPRTEYINYKKTDSGFTPLLTLILEGPESTYHHMGNVRYHVNLLDVEYIVTLTLFDLDGYMELLGYPLYNRTGDYSLYKRSDQIE